MPAEKWSVTLQLTSYRPEKRFRGNVFMDYEAAETSSISSVAPWNTGLFWEGEDFELNKQFPPE